MSRDEMMTKELNKRKSINKVIRQWMVFNVLAIECSQYLALEFQLKSNKIIKVIFHNAFNVL